MYTTSVCCSDGALRRIVQGGHALGGAQSTCVTATGTIHNSDPMPKAWIVRFGRTVDTQAVDAVTARLDGAKAPHVTVAGIGLLGQAQGRSETETDDPFALPEWATTVREPESRKITDDNLLQRWSFHLYTGGADGEGTAFTAWGNVTTGGFEADIDDGAMDGDVTTGFVGFDAEWERALAGVMLSQSRGTGGYPRPPDSSEKRPQTAQRAKQKPEATCR